MTGLTLRRCVLQIGLVLAVLAARPALAQRFAVPAGEQGVVGALRVVVTAPDETLLDIALRHRVGQDELSIANPGLDRWSPDDGVEVTLPTAYILPRAMRRGLVLNVPEMRLYYYPPHTDGLADVVHTYPVSIGRMDWATPLGNTRVIRKTKNPTWRPPKSIISERATEGEALPRVVPPGPDNPLGKFALRLGLPGYLIHGTNKPYGVGMRATHGCVRLYPEDIEQLYRMVPIGTPVALVDQPIKVGWLGNSLYIEVHALPEEEANATGLRERALALIDSEQQNRPFVVDASALSRALEERTGIPTPIGRAKPAKTAANR